MTWRALKPSRAEGVAALGSAVLFALAFPPLHLVVPVFVCLIPLAVFVARTGESGSAARVGFWFALLAFGSTLYWIAVALLLFTKLAILAYIATVLCLGGIYAATLAILWHARRLTGWPMAVLLPPLWVASEMLLMHLSDLSFPWLPLALGVSHSPHLAQLVDVSGEHGLSAVIAVVNGLLADAVLTRRVWRRAGLAVLIVVALYSYGAWRLATIQLRPLAPIMAVQPNIPEDEKMQEALRTRFIGILMNQTRAGLHGERPALIVWPETSLPDFLVNHKDWPDSIRTLAATSHVPLLFGVIDVQWYPDGTYDYYNAAMLADSTGAISHQAPYRKEFLVPIVERVPFINPRWFAGLKYFGGFGRGKDPEPFRLPFGSVGVVVCYESIFGDLFRWYRRKGTDVILNITNDAWFGQTNAPYQHVAHLRLRAIENRIGVVQVAQTGISEYVDP
ncbi:MAG TPA: apolipoprotein N-acyltransferase, partial [Gemmatimonadaceae bacterium]|nr:apolipoprotein N-acyltransferase [Gemmatimonadaceae bacterium]